jgi:hypothetical protein
MIKKTRKKIRDLGFDPYDQFDDLFDEDFDAKDLSRDIYSTDWGDYDSSERVSARRRIERRNDMRNLSSELDEWEEYADRTDW